MSGGLQKCSLCHKWTTYEGSYRLRNTRTNEVVGIGCPICYQKAQLEAAPKPQTVKLHHRFANWLLSI